MEGCRGIWTLYFLVLVGNIGVIHSKLSSHRLCYDNECKGRVSFTIFLAGALIHCHVVRHKCRLNYFTQYNIDFLAYLLI